MLSFDHVGAMAAPLCEPRRPVYTPADTRLARRAAAFALWEIP
jgi:hypothetical protein